MSPLESIFFVIYIFEKKKFQYFDQKLISDCWGLFFIIFGRKSEISNLNEKFIFCPYMSGHFTRYLIPGIYHAKIPGILGIEITGILRLKIPGIFTSKIPGIFS